MIDRAIPELDLTLTEGGAAAARGEWAAAEQAFRRAHDVAHAHGARIAAAVALSNAGQAALRRGALDEADALLTRALEARAHLVQTGAARGAVLARAVGDLAIVRHARGATAEAADLLARAAATAADGDPALAETYHRELAAIAPDAAVTIPVLDTSAPSAAVDGGAARVEIIADGGVEEVVVTTVPPRADDADLPLLDVDDAPPAETAATDATATHGLPMLDVEEPVAAHASAEPTPWEAPVEDRLAPLDLSLDDVFGAPTPVATEPKPQAPTAAAALLDLELDAPGDATPATGETPAAAAIELAPVGLAIEPPDAETPALDALPLMDVGDALDFEPAPATLAAAPALGFEPTVPTDTAPAPTLAPLDLDATLVDADAAEPATTAASPAGLEQLSPPDAEPQPAGIAAQPPDGWAPDPEIAGLAVREAVARETAAVEDLLATADGSPPLTSHGFDLDAIELAGTTATPAARSPAPAPSADGDDLSFLRTPAGGVTAVGASRASRGSRAGAPGAEAPIEDVLAELDVELGLAQARSAASGPAPVAPAKRQPLAGPAPDSARKPLAGPAPDSTRKPLAPPAPDSSRRDDPPAEKSSWWRRLKESTKR